MTYVVYTDLIDHGDKSLQHYLEADHRELEVMIALHADEISDYDGEIKSYYIADPDVLNRIADQYDVAVEIFEP